MADNSQKNTKIKRISMVDQVCNNIKNYISSEHLHVGDKLPSEGELADCFGVNRLTVRMALQKLITLGVIETRIGEGSYICDFTFLPYLNELSDFYLSSSNLDEIRTLRRLIEMESVKLLINNASSQELDELKKTLDEYLQLRRQFVQTHDKETHAHLVEKDLDFHYQLCVFSHNTLFKDLFILMRPLIRQHVTMISWQRSLDTVTDSRLIVDPHIQLYENIVQRDWKTCKAIYPLLIGEDLDDENSK